MLPFVGAGVWDIWRTCGYDRQAQKNFWADAVLYVRTNPGKAPFFEQLIAAGAGHTGRAIPLPVLVKRMLKASRSFDRALWDQAIAEWAKIKADLKLALDDAIRREPRIIESFSRAILDGSSRTSVFQVAGGSGLPRHYQKSDIILMLCSILSQVLSAENTKKEIGPMTSENVFQIAEETAAATAQSQESADSVEPGKTAFQILWEGFLSEIAELDPLEDDWTGMEHYVTVLTQIADQKSRERMLILRQRELALAFMDRLRDICRSFGHLLREFNIDLALTPENLETEQIEAGLAALDGLGKALAKYGELSASRSTSLIEEKRRLGMLFTTMTDIENLVKVIDQTVRVHQIAEARDAGGSAVTVAERRALLSDGEADEETTADGQLDLFIRPDK